MRISLPLRSLHQTVIIVSVAGLLLPSFSFGATAFAADAQQQSMVPLPSTFDEAGTLFVQSLKGIPKAIGEAFGAVWTTTKQLFEWARELWDKYVRHWIQRLWQKILSLLGTEIQKRKPIVEQELEKEKQEITREAAEQARKAGEGLWERLKNLIKNSL